MADIALRANEEMIYRIKGDYWQEATLSHKQISGVYFFTNQRVSFFNGFLGRANKELFSIEYAEIESVTPVLIQVFPFGIRVKTKDGKQYKLSLLGRKKYLELLQNKVAALV